MRGSSCVSILALLLLVVFSAMAQADIKIRTLDGVVLAGRIYDLGNEYLELAGRLGSNPILKRNVKSWSQVELETSEPPGIILVFLSGHEVSGSVRFDTGPVNGSWTSN